VRDAPSEPGRREPSCADPKHMGSRSACSGVMRRLDPGERDLAGGRSARRLNARALLARPRSSCCWSPRCAAGLMWCDQAAAANQGIPPHPDRLQAGEGAGRGGAQAAAQARIRASRAFAELVLALREAHGGARDGLPLDSRAQARLRRDRPRAAPGRHERRGDRAVPRGAAGARAARPEREARVRFLPRRVRGRGGRVARRPARGRRPRRRARRPEIAALRAGGHRLPLPRPDDT
jgi:hypothetical protein